MCDEEQKDRWKENVFYNSYVLWRIDNIVRPFSHAEQTYMI